MKVEFSWSMYDGDDNETKYTIVANCTAGYPGDFSGPIDTARAPEAPEVEIEEIKNDQGSPIDAEEWAAHGFTSDVLAMLEDRASDRADDSARDAADDEGDRKYDERKERD